MKHFNLSAFIVSASVSALSLPSYALATPQPSDDNARLQTGASAEDTLPLPEASPPAEPEAPPAEERPYDAPLNDDPGSTKPVETDNDWSTPPNETGPNVDKSYNSPVDDRSVFSYLRIGPTIQLGFPHPLTYGIDAMAADIVSFGFSTGKYSVTQISKATIDIKSWDVHARVHPFMGSFFLGLAYGNQDVKGKFEDNETLTLSGFPATVPVRVDAAIKSAYITPHLGWLAIYESGFTMGLEIGAQIPLSPKTSVEGTVPGATPSEVAQIEGNSDYKDLKKKADDTLKILGKRTVPYVTLLKLGWLF
ncbi:MAG: hypothetical protein H7249_05280 [Chitinophagaceae bacterium]|nr:hypothetical protein [Oligoflexus sp.]